MTSLRMHGYLQRLTVTQSVKSRQVLPADFKSPDSQATGLL
jgi:hypothetical protein